MTTSNSNRCKRKNAEYPLKFKLYALNPVIINARQLHVSIIASDAYEYSNDTDFQCATNDAI